MPSRKDPPDAALLAEAARNPFRMFSTEELALLMHLSERAIRSLAAWGAPFIAKRSRPEMLLRWMSEHPDSIQKLE